MKLALLPIALLALTLPAPVLAYPSLAYPTKVVYRINTPAPQPMAPGYQAAVYGQPAYPTYGYGAVPRPPVTVVRYRVSSPYGYPGAPSYGYGAPMAYGAPPAAVPVAQTCSLNAGRALVGAALGGLASAALAPRAKDRRWAVPVGAAIGGLGGLATGC
jgi:hypothetical protein